MGNAVNAVRIVAVKDPATKRHTASCPIAGCAYVADRAKRDTAEWLLSQHLAYTHGVEVAR